MDTTETNPEENNTPKQLGELLKSYRKTANIDIDQAADTLCLTVGTLKALENEDFDQLPEAPYLRGYLRGYAKLANVNSAEVISLYEDIRGGSSISDTQYNFTPSTSIDDIIKPIVPSYIIQLGTLAVILLLFAIIYMIPGVKEWSSDIWDEFSQKNVVADQGNTENAPKTIEKTPLAVATADTQRNQPPESLEAKNTTIAATPPPSIPDANKEGSEMEGAIKRESTTDTPPPKVDTSKSSEKAVVNTTQETNSDSSKPETVASNTTEKTEANKNSSNTTTETNTTPTAPPTATATTPVDMTTIDSASGEVIVKLVFKDEVWMRVNSKRKKVFSGLKKMGDSEEFKTKKPLSFKVGNSPGVDIYINGKLYDQTPYMRGVVAKFKVKDI